MGFLLTISMGSLQAQKAVDASGGDASGTGGTVSYSIGQIDYMALSATSGKVNEGVQQPNNSASVPVTMLSLKALRHVKQVTLNWSTATEANSSHFVAEKSVNGVEFTEIGRVKAAGISNILRSYTLNDIKPIMGWNYYRIKEVDVDGRFMFSQVAAINFNTKESMAVIYPNPTSGNITLNIANTTTTFTYSLFDAQGKWVMSKNVTGAQTVIPMAELAPANYVLKLTDNNREIQSFKILKSK